MSQHRDYIKKIALFQCENNRDHTWKSAHAWEQDLNEVFCDICAQRASVVDMKDEMCRLAIFVCPCGERWASLTEENDQIEQCESCLADLVPNGVQERNATHFWYKCSSTDCAIEWEAACVVEKFSQRCNKCFGAGKIIGTRNETKADWVSQMIMMKKRRKKSSITPNKGHDMEGCDMCQKFKQQGKETCRPFKKVVIDYEIDGIGNLSTKIVNWIK